MFSDHTKVVRGDSIEKTKFSQRLKSFQCHPKTLPWACLVKCKVFVIPIKLAIQKFLKECCGMEWNGVTEYIYKKLPERLSRLKEQGFDKANFHELQGLYDPEIELKPSWIDVFDLSRD